MIYRNLLHYLTLAIVCFGFFASEAHAADPKKGMALFNGKCATCHNGSGKMTTDAAGPALNGAQKRWADAGADIYNFHYEACKHAHRLVQAIKKEGMMAGITLNPHTPVHLLEDIITDLDLVLLMSVNPGFGGQKFIPNAIEKVSRLRELIDKKGSKSLIQVDGGVDNTNANTLYNAGADCLVSGSYLFKAADFNATVLDLKK